jgi:hypothetical protein
MIYGMLSSPEMLPPTEKQNAGWMEELQAE